VAQELQRLRRAPYKVWEQEKLERDEPTAAWKWQTLAWRQGKAGTVSSCGWDRCSSGFCQVTLVRWRLAGPVLPSLTCT
jgi:hypothetical protein